MNMYVGSQMSEKELQRLQKIMSGGQISEKEKKRISDQIQQLQGGQMTDAEVKRLYKMKP
jgi:hypothetical protein